MHYNYCENRFTVLRKMHVKMGLRFGFFGLLFEGVTMDWKMDAVFLVFLLLVLVIYARFDVFLWLFCLSTEMA